MKTERNAVLRRPPKLDHPNMELKGIYQFMEKILQEINEVRRDIDCLREDIFQSCLNDDGEVHEE